MSKLLSSAFVGGLELNNRVVMSPMCMYEVKKEDGILTPFHIAHYTSKAISKVALMIVEATAIEEDGRITKNDLGLWNDSQKEEFKKLVDNVHYLGSKIGIQISHAGRKAANAIILKAPSAIEFSDEYGTPVQLSKEDILGLQDKFVESVKRADEAGFDMIEIHGAHGYLISQFLESASNQREDEYGGNLENRFRFLKETILKIREVYKKPLWVRLSVHAYCETQNSLEDWIQVVKWLEELGVNCVDISTGGVINVKPTIPVFDGFQSGFAAKIKEKVSIDIATVGLLDNFGLCEYLLQNNHADLILQGRSLLRNINWLNDAAKHLHDKNFKPYNEAYARGIK